jgi:subtilisin family serine protease
MSRSVFILFTAIITWVLSFGAGLDSSWADESRKSHAKPSKAGVEMAPGRIIVKFKAGLAPGPEEEINAGPVVARGVEAAIGLSVDAQSALDRIGARVEQKYTEIGLYRVAVDETMRVGEAIESLYRSGTVEYAEPDFVVKINVVPNDPYFSYLWGMNNTGQVSGVADADIDAPEGWNQITSAAGVVVAVIDTGVDYTHEDLSANMWRNSKETNCSDGIDNDGNGYVDDCYGINSITGSGDPMDDHYHGTHCAGTIGARGNNGKGVAGMAWITKIMALKFLNSSGSGYTSDAIECINYAIAIKKRDKISKMILSNSWGGSSYDQALYDAIKTAQNNNILFVAAAGNNYQDSDIYPAYPGAYNLPGIISVGASDSYDQKPSFSNWGAQSVDIFAPGDNVYSCKPGNSYQYLSGTSMATPHVAGASAIVWTKFPTQSALGVKAIVLNGAEDGRATPAPYFKAKSVTEGRLNLLNSLQSAIQNDPAIFSINPYRASAGQTITIEGVRFGDTPGSLIVGGVTFPSTSIVSWADGKIVAKVPANCPGGPGRLKASTAAGVSRGAVFFKGAFEAQVGQTLIARGWGASAQIGNDLWLIGGSTYWGMTGIVERYNMSTNRSVADSSWSMPVVATNAGAAAIGNKIYVVGGLDWNTSQSISNLQIFDTTTGKWTQGKKLPVALHQPAVAVYNGKIYAMGGRNSSSYSSLNSCYEYNPSTNTWSAKANLPTGTGYAGAVTTATGRILVLGGFSTAYYGSEQNIVQEYNPAANTWSTKSPLVNTHGAPGVTRNGSKIFCMHGSGNGSYAQTGSEWTMDTTWVSEIVGPALYTARSGSIPSGTKTNVLTATGYNGSSYVNGIWKVTK